MLQRAFLSLLLAASISSADAAAPTSAQLNQARTAGLAWLMTHQSGDGSWKDASGASVQTTSSAITALVNAGIKQGYPFTAGLAYLQNAQPSSVDALARQITTLNGVGVNVGPQVALLNQWQNGNSAWGAYKGYGSSLPDTPLAMSALFQTHAFNTANAYNTLCFGLLYAVRSDNSFSYIVNGASTPSSQASGNLIPTAYAAVALSAAPANTGFSSVTCNRLVNGSYVPTAFTLNTVLNNALTWMLSKQNATDGGFGDANQSTALETAVAYLSLNQIAPSTYATQLGNAAGYLVAQQNADGSWGGDPLATALALQTLPTLASGALADSNKNGVPDTVESFLGKNPATADRTGALGNGLSVSGNTTAKPITSGNQSSSFTFTLSAAGGTAPFTWKVTSGFLPDGLSLNTSTGLISGVPSTAGTFNFVYSTTDSTGSINSVASQITIAAADTSADTPTLPQWAAILMGLLLMGSITLQNRRQWI